MDTHHAFMVVLAFGCSPLEDRIELFDVEWCADARVEPAACIVDGDTFDLATCAETDVAESERVRMLGVDAPEVAHGDEPADCYGAEASDYLADVLEGRALRLEFDDECEGNFGRTLAWVFIDVESDDPLAEHLVSLDNFGVQEDGSFEVLVNELVIRAGYARLYSDIGEGRYDRRLIEAAQQAAYSGEGLWGVCNG